MSLETEAEEIIEMLESGDFYAQCPCCNESIPLNRAGLFFLDNFTSGAEELYKRRLDELRERRAELEHRQMKISQSSRSGAKAVNLGFVLEHLAPVMGGFPFELCDCRSLFKPIDYLIFHGLSSKGKVDCVVFVDIKTGHSRLSPPQKAVRSLVECGKVVWDMYTPEAEA
jgi:predicted Holliday junction resolvase-like endonuclease